MAKHSKDTWDPDFLQSSPVFFALKQQALLLTSIRHRWPNLEDYQQVLMQQPNPPVSLSGKKIQFVEQAHKSENWFDDYEPRIYLQGEVQTRTNNWHDFFQVLMWSLFPKTKSMLNAKHFSAIEQRLEVNPDSKQRSPLENALTQFDECGAIIVSSDEMLLQYIRDFQWHTLFWKQRSKLESSLRCYLFGHALYEKALHPYIGLTAYSILFAVKQGFFEKSLSEQVEYLDKLCKKAFFNNEFPTPKYFHPFPVLGMPGWDKNNKDESYYHNVEYFRPGRKTKKHQKC